MALPWQTVQAALEWVSETVKELEMNSGKLVVQNETLRQKVKELEESRRDLVTRNEILQEKVGKFEASGRLAAQLETAHKTVSELEENRCDLVALNETLQEKVEELEVSNGLRCVQLETLHKKVTELEESRNDLLARNKTLQSDAEVSGGLAEQIGSLHKRVNQLEGNSRDLTVPNKILQEGANSLGMSGEPVAPAETLHKKVHLVARRKVLQKETDKLETSCGPAALILEKNADELEQTQVDELRGRSWRLQNAVDEPQERSQQSQDVVSSFMSVSPTEKPTSGGAGAWSSSWEERTGSDDLASAAPCEERDSSEDSPWAPSNDGSAVLSSLPSPWPRGSAGWAGWKRERGRYEEVLCDRSSKQVKVENLPSNFDRRKWRELKSVFGSAGKIEQSKLDREVAWITYKDEAEAQEAVKKFNGKIWTRNPIKVSMPCAAG